MYENKYIVRRLMRAAKKQTVDQVMDHSKDMTQKNFNKALAKAKTDTAEIIRDMKDGHYFTKTWLYDFLYKALLPIVAERAAHVVCLEERHVTSPPSGRGLSRLGRALRLSPRGPPRARGGIRTRRAGSSARSSTTSPGSPQAPTRTRRT